MEWKRCNSLQMGYTCVPVSPIRTESWSPTRYKTRLTTAFSIQRSLEVFVNRITNFAASSSFHSPFFTPLSPAHGKEHHCSLLLFSENQNTLHELRTKLIRHRLAKPSPKLWTLTINPCTIGAMGRYVVISNHILPLPIAIGQIFFTPSAPIT